MHPELLNKAKANIARCSGGAWIKNLLRTIPYRSCDLFRCGRPPFSPRRHASRWHDKARLYSTAQDWFPGDVSSLFPHSYESSNSSFSEHSDISTARRKRKGRDPSAIGFWSEKPVALDLDKSIQLYPNGQFSMMLHDCVWRLFESPASRVEARANYVQASFTCPMRRKETPWLFNKVVARILFDGETMMVVFCSFRFADRQIVNFMELARARGSPVADKHTRSFR
jgi:hypothetical protein